MENEAKNEVQTVKAEIQSVKEIKTGIQAIQEVLKSVMIKGCHYDQIPGCGDKPVLLKSGAEKILATFRIGVETIIEDLSDDYERRYRVTCRGFFIPTGNTVGFGIGEGATAEKKYAWRKAVCDEEFDAAIETRRQEAWVKEYVNKKPTGKYIALKQVRQNPSDIANTVLKMAKKRAMIDLCLTATACSDIFAQDLDEDNVQAHIEETGGGQAFQRPQSTQTPQSPRQAPSGDIISEAQAKRLFAIVMAATKRENGYRKDYIDGWLFSIYGIKEYKDTPKLTYNEICDRIESGTIPTPQV